MYIVKDEDSLLSISKNKLGCHTKYSDLIRMNQLASTIIYPGQNLRYSE
ncbi:MAG: LysM peptidoglycan-binding domain-containing protein [Clostridium sp.]|nr:LysM peptidoglycan-binding domain-containing protein [Clostridium sp.]